MSFSSFQLLGSGATILVFGKDGQVGKALQNTLNDLKIPTIFIGRAECDLADEWAIKKTLNQYQPHVVINAAAYTAVDQAEKEPELAYAINAKAPEIMAHYVATISHGVFVHYSTDYVFDGAKDAPYVETDVVKIGRAHV